MNFFQVHFLTVYLLIHLNLNFQTYKLLTTNAALMNTWVNRPVNDHPVQHLILSLIIPSLRGFEKSDSGPTLVMFMHYSVYIIARIFGSFQGNVVFC